MKEKRDKDGEGEGVSREMGYAKMEEVEVVWDVTRLERIRESMTPEGEGFGRGEGLRLQEGEKRVWCCWKT